VSVLDLVAVNTGNGVTQLCRSSTQFLASTVYSHSHGSGCRHHLVHAHAQESRITCRHVQWLAPCCCTKQSLLIPTESTRPRACAYGRVGVGSCASPDCPLSFHAGITSASGRLVSGTLHILFCTQEDGSVDMARGASNIEPGTSNPLLLFSVEFGQVWSM
jgi:hypothetical protein